MDCERRGTEPTASANNSLGCKAPGCEQGGTPDSIGKQISRTAKRATMAGIERQYRVPDPPLPTQFPLASPRGARLATRVWWNPPSPNEPKKAIVVITHGGGWHSGYFAQLAHYLNRSNIFVAAYDVVSHGYSDVEPGSPEGCIHVHEFEDYVEDIWAAVEWAQREAHDFPGKRLPVFLLGESFGGLQVLSAGLAYSTNKNRDGEIPEIAGIITLGGLLQVVENMLPPRPVISVLEFLSHYYPKLKMPATDFGKTFDEAFGDKRWAATARQDPAVSISPIPTLGGAVAMLTTGNELRARVDEWKLPLLAVHSKHDCRTDFQAMQEFVDRAGSQAEGFWLDETTGHQLLQDVPEVTEKVMEKVKMWLLEQVEKMKH